MRGSALDLTLKFNWRVAVQFYRNPKSREHPGEAVQTEVDYASPLNSEQLAVWHIFRRHCCHVKNGREPPPILMYVDGAGGTGKPFVINAVSEVLETKVPGSVVRAAPTGIAVNAINDAIHSLLRLATTPYTGRDSPTTLGEPACECPERDERLQVRHLGREIYD